MTISVWILRLFKYPLANYKKVLLSLSAWLLLIFLLKIISAKPLSSEYDYSNANFKVLGLSLPARLEFAGELVPQNDYEIKENLEEEFFNNKSWKSSSVVVFQKARKWFSLIEPILQKEGIPDDFKYVAIIESHLENVVSPMGAAGFWQLMPETAKAYGLIVNEEVDERYDVEKSTYVACKHFKDGYNYFHNWTLSAAAYNIGIGGIQQALKKQNTNNYYDLLLNKETGSFVYRILAYKTLLSNPEHFGIKKKMKKLNPFPEFKIVKVDSSITHMNAFAKHIGTDIVTLKTFNAWLIGETLKNTEKHSYSFRVPKNKDIDLSMYYDDVFPAQASTDTTVSTMRTDSIKSATKDSIIHK